MKETFQKLPFWGDFQGSPGKQQSIKYCLPFFHLPPDLIPVSSPDQCCIVSSNHMGDLELERI